MENHAVAADMIAALHVCYLLFAVGGQALILVGAVLHRPFVRNIRFRGLHLAAVVAVGWEAAAGWTCPLTTWEYKMRLVAGQTVDRDISFVGRIARSILYYDLPESFFTVLHLLFAALVIATFIMVPPRMARRKAVAGR